MPIFAYTLQNHIHVDCTGPFVGGGGVGGGEMGENQKFEQLRHIPVRYHPLSTQQIQ